MGKKTVMGYGIHANPVIFPSVAGASGNKINLLQDLFIEQAVKKKFSLGFSVKLYKTHFDNSIAVQGPGFMNDPTGNYDIRGRNYSFYGKTFLRRYLAPWGQYFTFGLNVMTYKATYDPANMKVGIDWSGSVYSSDFGPLEQSYSTLDLILGVGRSRIFADKFVIDYGYNFNVIALLRPVVTVFVQLEDYYYWDDRGIPMNTYIEETSKRRIEGVNRFNFFFKVGYLF